jgi:4-hydroxy-2-oxoheptanedioate aldolase
MHETMIRMRPSRVLHKLRAGEVVMSTKLNLADSRVVEIAAMSGFDCIWTDMEHVANDWSVIERQILAAKAYGVDIIVRVARGSYSDLVRPLELDATGIMVPHVMSLSDARLVIQQTKFHPLGRRPVDGGNADGAYCNIEFTDYLQQANTERFNILQIEDPEAMDELEEIASMPGVDMIFFGPGDFSQGIGAPGQMDHPKIAEARKRIAETAAAKGIFAGTVGTVGNWDELVAMGYSFINIGADVIGLSHYYRQLRESMSGKQLSMPSGMYGEK